MLETMKTITKIFRNLLRDERGASAIEYGFLAALIATAFIVGAASLGTSINDVNEALSNEIDAVVATMTGADPDSGNSGVGDGDGGGKDGNNGNDDDD